MRMWSPCAALCTASFSVSSMRRTAFVGVLFLGLLACSSGERRMEESPAQPLEKPAYAPGAEIESLPVAHVVKDVSNGKEYVVRYFIEIHKTTRDEVPIVTVRGTGAERVATVEEWYEALRLIQAEFSAKAAEVDRAVNAWYNAQKLRAATTLDDQIRFKEDKIQHLEEDIADLQRQIKSEEEVNKGADKKQIDFHLATMSGKYKELNAEKAAVEVLKLYRAVRDAEIHSQKARYPHRRTPLTADDEKKINETNTRLRSIYELVAKYRARFKTFPPPDALVTELESIYAGEDAAKLQRAVGSHEAGRRVYVDAWGNEIAYEIILDARIKLTSKGLDGVAGTEDDLIFPF